MQEIIVPVKDLLKDFSIARMMAHITYLSDVGLENKFGRKLKFKAS